MPAHRKYTDQQHCLIRALVLLNEAAPEQLFTPTQINKMVGLKVPFGTLSRCRGAARLVIKDEMSPALYFTRLSDGDRAKER